MAVILIIIFILLLVLLSWSWHSLGNIEKRTKVAIIIGGLIIIYLITFVIFSISKIGIDYQNKDAMKLVQTIFVMLFTIVNGYIILPYVFKKLDQINNEEVEKEKIIRSLIILIIIFIIVAIFEVSYLGNMQNGILEMMKKYR